jgi:hypothetical protein
MSFGGEDDEVVALLHAPLLDLRTPYPLFPAVSKQVVNTS